MVTATATLDTPLRRLLGNGAAKLATELDLHTVRDLLFHFPRRYEQRGSFTEIRSLEVGEDVTVLAQVLSASVRRMRQRSGEIAEVVVGDDSGGRLTLTFFGKATYRVRRDLKPGRWGLFAGKVGTYQHTRQLTHPDFHLVDEPDGDPAGTGAAATVEEYLNALIPIYPATAKVQSWDIARAVRVVLDVLGGADGVAAGVVDDPLPERVRAGRRLTGLATALRDIHRPGSARALSDARRRLKWDEALAVQLTLVQRKLRAADWPAKARPPRPGGLRDRFDATLPYQLTAGQRQVGEEIAADLAAAHPMHRLLQGEVGSGKTVCALRAALQVVDAGGQAALLAPTEVLAAQHYRGLAELLGPLGRAGELDGDPEGTRLALLTGSLGAAARRQVLASVAAGEAGIVVGTHALLYEGVDFRDLGLVVVDEQHRFGVEQRDALRAKADQPPHVLVMTATPIPRTVAMTVYGDLEVSTLKELPRGRSPIATHVVPSAEKPAYLDRAWQRVREEVSAGHQAYVVCPRIGGTEGETDAEEDGSGAGSADTGRFAGPPAGPAGAEQRRPPLAVREVAPLLADGPLAGLRMGVLHGRLPADEKDAVMRAFASGALDVLVATTVVEVGVDVPNATMMVVLDADRFGVSQLHQLRGRVGRGSAAGLCLLVTDAAAGSDARTRLDAVASTLDGFQLAELDLEQRREGDVLGAVQSGRRSHLRLLSLLRDADLIRDARAEAVDLLADDQELDRQPLLARAVAALVDEERAEYLEKG